MQIIVVKISIRLVWFLLLYLIKKITQWIEETFISKQNEIVCGNLYYS